MHNRIYYISDRYSDITFSENSNNISDLRQRSGLYVPDGWTLQQQFFSKIAESVSDNFSDSWQLSSLHALPGIIHNCCWEYTKEDSEKYLQLQFNEFLKELPKNFDEFRDTSYIAKARRLRKSLLDPNGIYFVLLNEVVVPIDTLFRMYPSRKFAVLRVYDYC